MRYGAALKMGENMKRKVFDRHASFPIGFRHGTDTVLTLAEVAEQPKAAAGTSVLTSHGALTTQQKIRLTRMRWEAGDWEDVIYDGRVITLAEAIDELENQSDVGKRLLLIELDAIEMLLKDLNKGIES